MKIKNKLIAVIFSLMFGCSVNAQLIGSFPSYYSTAYPWYIGGNNLYQNMPVSAPPTWTPLPMDIGTTTSDNFILKANNIQRLFITVGGNIGINSPAPSAILEVSGSVAQSSIFRIYSDLNGNLASTTDMRFNAVTGKAFMFNEGTVAANTTRMVIKGGNVGIGTTTPGAKLDIADPSYAHINVTTTSTSPAKISVSNSYLSYYIGTDNAIGRIGITATVPTSVNPTGLVDHPLLNFQSSYTNGTPQVWIGATIPTSGPHSDFNLAVDGKIFGRTLIVQQPVAGDAISVVDASNVSQFKVNTGGVVYSRELIVTLTAYPDYVFNKEYKLMPLEKLNAYIQKNHHLPNVPSAKEIEDKGANLGELSKIQMEKIEELTLYILELEKRLSNLEKNK